MTFNNEFQCAICDSTFVEEVNQGIEQFLDESAVSSSRLPESRLASSTKEVETTNNAITSNSQRPNSNREDVHSATISHVLDRVLGNQCIKYHSAFYK